ncbi:MAG TPA: diphthine--ammonia ligase [Alphaproteobacteria bacterium]|nr:diphthine--ammonia ligase [Alphaproteobacteria bacterium]
MKRVDKRKTAKKTVKKVSKSNKSKIARSSTRLNTAVLFSGGKDSGLALQYALEKTNVKCLIILKSQNPESYMFHTPNINLAEIQAKNTEIPFIVKGTQGLKETELADLEDAIKQAIKKYKVQGIVTGAIESIYQASRIQAITNNLGIECFNPLWQKDQIELLHELIKRKFKVSIIGTFAYGMDKMIGRIIDEKFIQDITILRDKYKINPAGEGGEFESFVLEAPYYKKDLSIEKSKIIKDSGSFVMHIESLKTV